MLKAVILIGGPQKGEEPGECLEAVELEWLGSRKQKYASFSSLRDSLQAFVF